MELDLSTLKSTLDGMVFALIKILAIPLLGALLIGLVLRVLKFSLKVVIAVASLLFIYGVYLMFNNYPDLPM